MIEAIISAVAVILVAVIEGLATKDRRLVKEQHAKAEKRSQLRCEENRLAMKMMNATMQLSVVTANALTGGHNNGNVERAKKAAEDASNDYEAFLMKVASEQLGKN